MSDTELPSSHLPPGQLPVWISRTEEVEEVEEVEVLEMVKMKYLGIHKGVTVMYEPDKHDQNTEDYCQQYGWRDVMSAIMFGSEDQCVIYINDIMTLEFISRGRNTLFIITRRG